MTAQNGVFGPQLIDGVFMMRDGIHVHESGLLWWYGVFYVDHAAKYQQNE